MMLLVEDIMEELLSIIVMVPLLTVGTEHLGLIQLIVIQLRVTSEPREVFGFPVYQTPRQLLVMVERDIAKAAIPALRLQVEIVMFVTQITPLLPTAIGEITL